MQLSLEFQRQAKVLAASARCLATSVCKRHSLRTQRIYNDLKLRFGTKHEINSQARLSTRLYVTATLNGQTAKPDPESAEHTLTLTLKHLFLKAPEHLN